MRLLLTRTLQKAEQMPIQVRVQDWEPIVAPLLKIRSMDGCLESLLHAQAVLSSSRNAAVRLVEAVRSNFSPRLYRVGPAAAEPLLEAGFNPIYTADGTAHGLANMITTALDPTAGRLVYLSADIANT